MGSSGLGVSLGVAGKEGTSSPYPRVYGSLASQTIFLAGCPRTHRCLLGVPLGPRESGEKAGGSQVQTAHSTSGGRPSSRAPGDPQRWEVLREAKVAQVQAGGHPGRATPPPSSAASADPPPEGRSVPWERSRKVEVSIGHSCPVQGPRPRGQPLPPPSNLCPAITALKSCVFPMPSPPTFNRWWGVVQEMQLQGMATVPTGPPASR